MKLLTWFGAMGLFLVGLFFATSKRTALQRAASLQDQRVKVLQNNKTGAGRKADELSGKIVEQMGKAQAADIQMDARIKTLKARKETSLADRVSDFNKTL